MDSIQLSTLAALAGKWQSEADCGVGSADRRAALRECADTVRMLCEVRFEDCPHAAPHRYCAECPVSPCPIGLGEHAVAKRGAVPEGDDGKRVLREVFTLCEDTEAKCSEETGDFSRGRSFEAKGIARAIGAWYQEEFCGRTHMGEPVAPDQFRDATRLMDEPADGAVRLKPYIRHCQNGGDVCLASRSDGIVCPDDSCDIDSGVRIAPTTAEVPMPEPVAYLYTLEYGETVAGRRLSEHQLNYPFGVCGSDYLAQTDDGVSYVRQTPLYTKDAEAAGYARGLKDAGSVLGVERGILEAALHGDAKPAKCDGNHGGPRCADPECWQDPAGAVIYVRMEAERLVKSALAVGVVLTIDTQPRQPLAMGNYDLLVQTREVRNG